MAGKFECHKKAGSHSDCRLLKHMIVRKTTASEKQRLTRSVHSNKSRKCQIAWYQTSRQGSAKLPP